MSCNTFRSDSFSWCPSAHVSWVLFFSVAPFFSTHSSKSRGDCKAKQNSLAFPEPRETKLATQNCRLHSKCFPIILFSATTFWSESSLPALRYLEQNKSSNYSSLRWQWDRFKRTRHTGSTRTQCSIEKMWGKNRKLIAECINEWIFAHAHTYCTHSHSMHTDTYTLTAHICKDRHTYLIWKQNHFLRFGKQTFLYIMLTTHCV